MKVISTTVARKQLGHLIETVREHNSAFGIGRRNRAEAILIKYPEYINLTLDPWTQFAANGGGFDFWADEPELYSIKDIKRRYD